jgi:hypothetical protein
MGLKLANQTPHAMSMRPAIIPPPSVFELVMTQHDVALYMLAFIRGQILNPTVQMGTWTPHFLPA